jgi:hemoglobin-like flavoprotein
VVDGVVASLEIAAELIGDLTEPVYAAYYEECPEAQALMAHVDMHMQGRMLDEVLRLLMTADFDAEEGYLDFEVENHRGYNVEPEMYPGLFRAVESVVREGLGARWTEVFDTAWAARLDALLEEISTRTSAA